MGAVLIVDGDTASSKSFVKKAEELGYVVKKINPKRVQRDVVRLILPRHHEEDGMFFDEADVFLQKNSGYLRYIQKKLHEFFETEECFEEEEPFEPPKQVAILVNISKNMRHILEEEVSVFRILATDTPPENQNGYDRVIETSGSDFSERVESTLRIIQS